MKHIMIAFIMLQVCSNAYADPAKENVQQNGEARAYETLDSLFYLYQPYLSNISSYEPIYFLVGSDPEKSKFQFSFKYRFVDKDSPAVREQSWLSGLHFGYTQTSFWNLKNDSLPFEDTSYKPELFHLSRNLDFRPSWAKGLFLQSGLQHESNGQAEPLSRSTNYFYLRPILIFYSEGSKLGLAVSPKVWTYIDNSKSNADLEDYRGYFQLDLIAGKADSLVMGTSLGWASEGGSVQMDVSYPAGRYLTENFNIYLHFQYVNALAESLLHYQDRVEAFRFGFSFVR